jgi:imidazole glycerol-phosphate synthase subunit HisH
MDIIVIKYNAGNIGSVANALGRLGKSCIITDDPDTIRRAGKVIFPGVGEASTTMKYLRDSGLDQVIPALKQPVLGICLGMQLMCSWSEEGDTEGLGIFPEKVRLFRGSIKVPHMGWNSIKFSPEGLFRDIPLYSYVYFVHSYYAETGKATLGTCDYGYPFSAALHRDNFYAVQFHPEKSGEIGQKILKNFIEL